MLAIVIVLEDLLNFRSEVYEIDVTKGPKDKIGDQWKSTLLAKGWGLKGLWKVFHATSGLWNTMCLEQPVPKRQDESPVDDERGDSQETRAHDLFEATVDYLAAGKLLMLKKCVNYSKPIHSVGDAKSSCLSKHEASSYSASTTNKKQRSQQRLLSQVITMVSRWRLLHNESQHNGQRISLIDAAKVIGLPKKSLDDYCYQLRLGEKYGFNFQAHLHEKVGVLRNYLREKQPRLGGKFKLERGLGGVGKDGGMLERITQRQCQGLSLCSDIAHKAQVNQSILHSQNIYSPVLRTEGTSDSVVGEQSPGYQQQEAHFYSDFDCAYEKGHDPFLGLQTCFDVQVESCSYDLQQ